MSEAHDCLCHFVMQKLRALPEDEVLRRLKVLGINFQPQSGSLNSPICKSCGMPMTTNGSCFKCANCGDTSGCS